MKGIIRGKVRAQEPLNKRTTFRIGGAAEVFIEPKDTADLKLLLKSARKNKKKVLIIGAGSNILAPDKGVNAIVVKLSSPAFTRISCRGIFVEAGTAVSLNNLVRFTAGLGLKGAEFLAGIPGTLGGALVMNAGAWGGTIGALVAEATVLDYNGITKILKRKGLIFQYRKSNLEKFVILSARLKLEKADKTEIIKQSKKYLAQRKITQDNSFCNAGCIFKNPKGKSAGALIDSCGLKGMRVGDAWVSSRHANFILNKGKASAQDVLDLMDIIKKRVKAKLNINLQPEIKIWQ